MAQPKTAAKTPQVMELEPGVYYWCRCGESKNQPFCDGSHQGTGLEPLEFEQLQKKTVALCQCKQTINAPFCDGSHTKL